MNILIAFYSRTGNTKKISKLISNSLNCEYEEIIDLKKRTGFIIGFLKSGYDATRNKSTSINEIKKDPMIFDLIILGTPIWNKSMTPAMRTYIANNKSKFKKIAFFCTEGGKGGIKTFESMANLCDIEPISTLEITKKEIQKGYHLEKINTFIQELKSK